MVEVPGAVLVAVTVFAVVVFVRYLVRIQRLKASIEAERALAVKEFKKASGRTRVVKTVEKLVPIMEEFGFDPSDARFIGDPIDYVVFDGLTEGEVRDLVFIEVKSGRDRLAEVQRQVERCAALGRVRFGIFTIDPTGDAKLTMSARVEEIIEGAV